MSSRAASATTSRRAKQDLVRLLFGPKNAGKGPAAHRRLDYAVYSYSDLKNAYLERIQVLHPDKLNSRDAHRSRRESMRDDFVQLKEAWNRYEEVAKMMKRVDGDQADASFTMFGVGCSFSDNDAERAQRIEIMDQACRGWFSSGALGTGENEEKDSKGMDSVDGATVSLSDDDYFVEDSEGPEKVDLRGGRNILLVQGLIHPARR